MKLLTWIMSRFNVSPELIGDIVEDSAHHSAFWLLRQSTAAIVSSIRSGLWSHKLQTLSSLAVGWVLWFIVAPAMQRLVVSYAEYLAVMSAWAFVTGWAAAGTHREQPLGASLLFMATQCLAMVGGVARTIEAAYLNYPAPYASPLALQVLTDGGLVLATVLGAITIRPQRRPAA